MSGIHNNDKDDHDNDSVRIKRSTFTTIALGAVTALTLAAFFGGYILGSINAGLVGEGGGGSTTIAGTQQEGTGGGSAAVGPTAPSQANAPAAEKIQSISLDAAITMGKQDAPVTMVEFSDFQCPFCKRHLTTHSIK
ncbi:MAG TPA: thioredoxin domain-containing protein [Nitrososphaeraceae archaeon]|nr:thioredoxin domain-containing protein [Nitrososphaeraceae archaeon]